MINQVHVESVIKAFSINNTTDHQRTHISGKPYKCMYCDKSFSVKSGLIRHIRTHTGEKPYQCHECHKAFADNSTLIRHMYTHTLEKPYKCTQCDKSFAENRSLIKHIQTHTGKISSARRLSGGDYVFSR